MEQPKLREWQLTDGKTSISFRDFFWKGKLKMPTHTSCDAKRCTNWLWQTLGKCNSCPSNVWLHDVFYCMLWWRFMLKNKSNIDKDFFITVTATIASMLASSVFCKLIGSDPNFKILHPSIIQMYWGKLESTPQVSL